MISGKEKAYPFAARKASWNNMGVEPGNQEGPGC